MIGFDNAGMLYLLFGLPIFAWLVWLCWSYFRKFEHSHKVSAFTFGSKIPSWFIRILFASIRILVLALIIVALAEPYVQISVKESKYKNVRLFFLVDVSLSMMMAEDVKPNRLTAVRNEMKLFYSKLDGNYEIGIIPFAGTANPYYCPPTYSRSVLSIMTDKLSPEVTTFFGTDIASAFEALNIQIVNDKLDESGINLVVLITDGGKEESDATNRVKLSRIANSLSGKNTKIYTVGVGGKEPAVLMKRDKKGNFLGYEKEEDGSIATSQLDEEILIQLASQGKGVYTRFEKEDQLYSFLSDALRENRVADAGDIVYKRETIQGYVFASAAVLLWICFIVNRTRGEKLWKGTS